MADHGCAGRDDADEYSFEDVQIPLPAEEAESIVRDFLRAAFGAECYVLLPGHLAAHNGEWLFPLYASAEFGKRDERWLGTAFVAPDGTIRTTPDIEVLRKAIESIRQLRLSLWRIKDALREVGAETLQGKREVRRPGAGEARD